MTRCSSSYDKDFNEVSKDNTLLFENSEGSSAAGMSCLSMRFPCALSIDGISYRNAEQYILDSAGKPGTAEPAGETSGASGCLPCSRKAYRAALRANLEKFRSDPALGEALLSTGDAAIAYADSEDTFWGIGMSAQEAALIQKEEWRGANYLAKVLTDVRSALKMEKMIRIPMASHDSGAFLSSDGEEMLPVLDSDGRVTGAASRNACHHDMSLTHPVVHLHLTDRTGRVYLQHRSPLKEIQPDRWDTAVGGHISYGESVMEALMRESREELGIDATDAEPVTMYTFTSKREREVVYVFRLRSDVPPSVNAEEITEGRFWTETEIKEAFGKGILTPNFESEFTRLEDMILC